MVAGRYQVYLDTPELIYASFVLGLCKKGKKS
jgi:hypothetical protein